MAEGTGTPGTPGTPGEGGRSGEPMPPPGIWPPPPPGYGQPYAQPYPAQPYGQGGAPVEDKGATTAMIIGIVAAALGITCGVGFLLSPVALVMGRAAKRRIDASAGALGGRGNAQAAFVLGVVGTILLVLGILAVIVIVAFFAVAVRQDPTFFDDRVNA